MKTEMKKVKGKAGQDHTFWDSYQRIAAEQGVPSQNRTRRVCLYECITYLLFFSINCHPAAGISKTLQKRIFFNNTCSQSKEGSFQVNKKVIPIAVVKKDILAIPVQGRYKLNQIENIPQKHIISI